MAGGFSFYHDLRSGRWRSGRRQELLAVAGEKIHDGLDADLERTRGLVLVDVLEAEVGRPGALENFLDHRVERRIVAALSALAPPAGTLTK